MGSSQAKLSKIPLGTNTKLFNLPKHSDKKFIRKILGMPDYSIVIGSFQKDGTGWGEV